MIKIYNSGKVLVRTRVDGRCLSRVEEIGEDLLRVYLTGKSNQDRFAREIGKGFRVLITTALSEDKIFTVDNSIHVPSLGYALSFDWSNRKEILRRLRRQSYFITVKVYPGKRMVIKRYD